MSRSALAAMKRFLSDSSGATAIEYGLIALLLSVAIVVSVTQVGVRVTAFFNKIAAGIPN